MTRSSENVEQLNKAIVKFQAECTTIEKDSANSFFSSKYASLAQVVKTAAPILAKNGLAVMQVLEFDGTDDTITTRLAHESGEWIEGTARLHLSKNDAQGFGSATSYARRYAYMAMLGLVADEDDDGHRASLPAATPPVTTKSKATLPKSSPLDRAKQSLRDAIKLSGAVAADYTWVATASDSDVDRIEGLAAALRLGKVKE